MPRTDSRLATARASVSMMVELTRMTGIGRLRRDVRVDSEELAPEQRRRLYACVRELDLDDLQARSPMRGRNDERFHYEITVRDEGKVRHVIVDESLLSPALHRLLELLLDG